MSSSLPTHDTTLPVSTESGTEELLKKMTDRATGTPGAADIRSQYPELFETDPLAPEGHVPSASVAAPAMPARPTMFSQLLGATARVRPLKSRAMVRTLMAVGVLGSLAYVGARGGPAHQSAVRGSVDSAFDGVRNVVRTPGLFARDSAARVGGDFLAGAQAAESRTYEEVFASSTNAGVRLAVLAAEAESGLRAHNEDRLIDVLHKVEMVHGAATDRRALLIKAAIFTEFSHKHPESEVAKRWAARARLMQAQLPGAGTTVADEGLTPSAQREIALAVNALETDGSVLRGRSAEFQSGYTNALNQTVMHLDVASAPVLGHDSRRVAVR